jgi:thiol-disulfide isomerase/thioredoxin
MIRIKLLTLAVGIMTFLFGTAQEVTVFEHFEDYQHLLNQKNDTTYVINFWATWCKPCVEELPGFLEIDNKFRGQKFKMILTSLDFEQQIDSKLIPYIQNNDIEARVVLLTDPGTNVWINKVNEEWVGSIPATVIYNKDFYFFREGMLSYDELNELITNNIIP